MAIEAQDYAAIMESLRVFCMVVREDNQIRNRVKFGRVIIDQTTTHE